MKEIKYKYTKNTAQLWLFKVVLFFSVFAFSGFNEKIQDSFHESDTTELVESRNFQPVLCLKTFASDYLGIPLTGFQLDIKPDSSYALLHLKQSIKVKYKVVLKKHLTYNFPSIKFLVKLLYSSSLGEFPSFSIR